MRIAQVAPLFESIPPRLYGGTERVISYLTEELVRLGHEVTLFASGDSETNAKLVHACPRALWRDESCRETLPHHVRLMDLVFQDASRFDIIHFHCDYLHFPLLRRYPCPSVTTLHGRLHVPDLQPLFAEFAEVPLVSISYDQRGRSLGPTGRRRSITGCLGTCTPFGNGLGITWRSWAASPPRSGWTGPLPSRARPARGSKSRPRFTRRNATISTKPSSHCSTSPGPGSSSSARSAAGRRTSSWATHWRYCFPLIGRSRSAWS